MMRTVTAAAIAAALLLLAGCSAGLQEDVRVNSAPVASDTDAPLTAETPATSAVETGDAAFLEEVRAELRPDNVIPDATDAQLLQAGQEACEAIAANDDTTGVSVIDGEEPTALGFYTDSGVIISAARASLCS